MTPPKKFWPPAFLSGIIEKLNAFLESRDSRQRNMIVGSLFVLLLLADFALLIRPMIRVFTETVPQLTAEKAQLHGLQDDWKNKAALMKQWQDATDKLAGTEKQFLPRSEVPSLLEKLSKLAQDSQVKILTLKPLETKEAGSGLTLIPIRMSAVAGTHDLGHFLALLEGGPVYFRVSNLRITTNGSSEYRHTIELSIETYAKIK